MDKDISEACRKERESGWFEKEISETNSSSLSAESERLFEMKRSGCEATSNSPL
jgi:hypothetical protein